MVWVIAFGELFFGDLWCVVWGYGGMRTHFSLLNPPFLCPNTRGRGRGVRSYSQFLRLNHHHISRITARFNSRQ